MKKIEISKTKNTPQVILDKENSIFKIDGMSIAENAYEFYNPIMEWLGEYKLNPNSETIVHINMYYLNSSSVLYMARIMKVLSEIHAKGNKVLIKWYYNEDDLEIQEHGEELESLFHVPFELVSNEE